MSATTAAVAIIVAADADVIAAVVAGVRNRSRAFSVDVLLERSSTLVVEDQSPAGRAELLEPMLSEDLPRGVERRGRMETDTGDLGW